MVAYALAALDKREANVNMDWPDLYPYQRDGVDFLTDKWGNYLADVMGLGKTPQAVMAARKFNLQGEDVLILAPASVVPNWLREWARWWPGSRLPRVMSYSQLVRTPKMEDLVRPLPLVILDEAHYTKTPAAQRTRAALGLARNTGLAWLLSGTPMPNDPTELYTFFRYLHPDRLPTPQMSYSAWRIHFCRCVPTQYGPKVVGVRNGGELREMLNGILLRRTLDDVALDLPPLRVTLQLLPPIRELAAALEAERDDLHTASVRRILGEHKAAPVGDIILRELEDRAYDSLVVMYHHKATGAYLKHRLSKCGVAVAGFDGSTSQQQRQQEIDAFEEGAADVFLVQQQAGGVGINLTRASEIILLEPDWSPEVNAQAIKRVHRIGQDRPVRARIFAVEGSLDEAIMDTIVRKIGFRKEILE